ncbi:hypothetical protein RB195_005831 [Necator americanus]|uniref:Telomerase reverse transcriptase n=1 Tax=Necator americanus TaxID=51031 RepID=A0ABR1BPT5_NECAM
MFHCLTIGIKGLVQELGLAECYRFKYVHEGNLEEVKETVVCELSKVILETEADRVLTAAITSCKGSIAEDGFHQRIRSVFPQRLSSAREFLRNGAASEEHLYRFIEETANVFPRGFLGRRNTEKLLKVISHTLCLWKPKQALSIPMLSLNILECDVCRALRSRKAAVAVPVSNLQRQLILRIARFLTKFILANLIDFAFFFSATKNSEYLIFDKKGFKFWKSVEKRKFLRDYHVKTAPTCGYTSSRFIVNSTPCRTTVKNISQDGYFRRNQLRVLATCLDGYIKAAKLKPAGGLSYEIKRLKRFLKGHDLRHRLVGKSSQRKLKVQYQRLYFAKADISNCFANIDRKILEKALKDLLGDRSMTFVYGYGKVNKSTSVRVDAAAATYEEAVKSMILAMKKKRLRDSTRIPVNAQEIGASQIITTIMNLLNSITFSLDNSDTVYKMGKGVPQGFQLSCRLAHIYLLYFEQMSWKHLSWHTCLLRYVDDYLVCSYNRSEVQQVLNALQTPNVFGISARVNKCQASFRIPNIRRSGRYMKWCGWKVDTKRNVVFRQYSAARLIHLQRCVSQGDYAKKRSALRRLYKSLFSLRRSAKVFSFQIFLKICLFTI